MVNEQAYPEFLGDRQPFCEGLASVVNHQKGYEGVQIPSRPFGE